MTGPGGEMPFLDHLEELRTRLIKSLLALIGGFAIGLWIVQRLDLIVWLKRPIAQYLAYTGGKLVITNPTDSVMIVLKLSFVVGTVLASPVLIYQAWAFLSPALYERERRTMAPALLVGLLLFLVGAGLGWYFVVPQALRVFLGFQSEALAYVITYTEYFSFILQIVIALGLSFELPLVIIILAGLGLVTPAALNRFRRFWLVLACIAGALLSPGADVISMIMMTIPLLLLYEVGFAGAVIIQRRRIRAAATAGLVLLGLLLSGGSLGAQEPVPRAGAVQAQPRDSLSDSARARRGQALDTATARRLGLPTAPTRSFAPPDSLTEVLLQRPGYLVTQYRADTATVLPAERRLILRGEALAGRQGTMLQADSITYREASCALDASGSPALFDKANVMVGDGIRYNTCLQRGVVTDAFTDFTEGSSTWYLRGNIAQDSSAARLYAASSSVTSCDLPTPHYYFQAKEVKWTANHFIVARPAVLYIRDVPILWLPFVFQDTRSGRRSGILIPKFGINDLVRPDPSYKRQVTNVGYYWAPNDYVDFIGRLDWYSGRYTTFGFGGQYHWLDRFMTGSFTVSRTLNEGGARGFTIHWDHRQAFNLNTSLNLTLDYASNTQQVAGNAIDPLANTRTIMSNVNFTRRMRWGNLSLGATRRQTVSTGTVQMTLPTFTMTPKPVALGRTFTWSPAFSVTNSLNNGVIQSTNVIVGDSVVAVSTTSDSRNTSLRFDTPLRIGGFNWSNSVSVTDVESGAAITTGQGQPQIDPATGDTIVVYRTSDGDFSTGIDWTTSIGLPTLFRRSWKIQPSIGVANVAAGPLLLRNQRTGGQYVAQTKRLEFAITSSPTLFGFYPGFGPIARLRHSLSPVISYRFNPSAAVPADYAAAIGQSTTISPQVQTLGIGFSQNLEAKAKSAPGDTSGGANARKYRIFSLSTSPIEYDFEQAKVPGYNGWRTQLFTNTFQSDLLPGFNLTLQHNLWDGLVGLNTTHFNPYLQNVSANFAISGNTFRSLGRLLGLSDKPAPVTTPGQGATPYTAGGSGRPGSFFNTDPLQRSGNKGFTAAFNYSLSKTRATQFTPATNQTSLGLNTSFSPTPFWTVSWSTQYNFTAHRFESQILRLQRDLHEWRAGFDFLRNPNGNFAFYFSIALTDLPQLKFDYNQTSDLQ
jgi:Tat protein translocase TatC